MQDLKKNIVQSIYWNYISSLVIHGISILSAIVLTTLLSPDDFGVMATMFLILGLGSIFIGQGYAQSIVREEHLSDDMLNTIFWINTLIGSIVVLLAFLTSKHLEVYFDMPQLSIYLKIFSFAYLMQAINVVQLSLLKRKLNFKKHSIIHIWAVLISIIIAILLAYCDYGIYSLIWRGLMASIVVTVLVWFNSSWRPSFRFDWQSLANIHKFSRGVLGTNVLKYSANQFDNFIVAKILGSQDFGIYNRAKTFTLTATQEIHTKTKTVAYSTLSKLHSDSEYLKALVRFVLLLNMIIIPLILIVIISSDTLILNYLKEEWHPLADILKIAGLASIIISSGIPGQVLMSKGKSSLLFKTQLVNNIITISMLLIAFKYADLYTIVYLFVISQIITKLISNIVSYRQVPGSSGKVWKYHILPIIVGLSIYGVCLLVNQLFPQLTMLNTVIKILISLAAYGLFAWYTYPSILKSLREG